MLQKVGGRWRPSVVRLLCAVVVLAFVAAVILAPCVLEGLRHPHPGTTTAPVSPLWTTGRDKFRQSFSSTSIWNMPIGLGAEFADPHFSQPPNGYGVDEEGIVLSPNSPLRPVFSHPWPIRCYRPGDTDTGLQLPVPDGYLLGPQTWTGNRPNLAGGILDSDGRTFHELTYWSRCEPYGPVSVGEGLTRGTLDLYGDGLGTAKDGFGSHGGSMLSGLGGSIRRGELTESEPIRHTLKLTADMGRYGQRVGGANYFRWPALTADSDESMHYGSTGGGFAPILGMGSLLAIPPSTDLQTIHLETAPARKLAWTLQNYGMYVVDNAGEPDGWGMQLLCVEAGVRQEMQQAGVELVTNAGGGYANTAWNRDLNRLFGLLREITNQGPAAVGGGGDPRQPLAPPITD